MGLLFTTVCNCQRDSQLRANTCLLCLEVTGLNHLRSVFSGWETMFCYRNILIERRSSPTDLTA